MARVNELRKTDFMIVLKAPGAERCLNGSGVVIGHKILFSHQCSPECAMKKLRAYIHRLVFRPSQESSMWFGLMSREQLMP